MLNLDKKEVKVIESPITYEELLRAMNDVHSIKIAEPERLKNPELSTCDDCEEGHECTDCNNEKIDSIMSDNTETAYNFNLVVPSKNDAPAESETDKRRRMIYIGIGLITVFIFVFIALKASKKTA